MHFVFAGNEVGRFSSSSLGSLCWFSFSPSKGYLKMVQQLSLF